ncbi:DUF72 domain-containing protein [Nonomuraea sp. B12E4]|uniref:DUF72 domain-containing protein n=1 Tax=Nonomuraea sp. B12E4 TaxID=3153564 RepID=UPI00325EB0DB
MTDRTVLHVAVLGRANGMTWLVGTSGWQYRHWRGVLYPPGVPLRLWLETYAEAFATVESNNAFYRLPTPESFAGWRDRTPDGFVMAVKASRFLTHIKRLADPEEPVERLMGAAAELKDKLGPILLQLPPTLKAAPDRLDRCLGCFPAGVRVAVEPRHDSWWTQEVRDILRRHGAALCWGDRLGRPQSPFWRTAEWGYVRLHEGRAGWEYGDKALKTWAGRLREAGWQEVYVYFNNDPEGAAVRNAKRFARLG